MALGVAAASECGICMRGRCFAPNPLRINSEDITASLSAIDFENNILYVVKNGLQAIHLDDNTISLVQTSRPNDNPAYLTIDQVSSDVYYSYGPGSLYKYQPKTNVNVKINQSTSKHIWAYNGTLYTAGLAKGLSAITESSKKSVDTFKNIKVKSVTFDKFGNMYAGTASKVYKVKPNEDKKVLKESNYGLKNDRNGNVYLVEYKKHLIHQVDINEQLNLVGAFGAKYYDYIHNFKFDKYDNIVAKFPNTRTLTYFKDTSERCTISNPENPPYTDSLRIINLNNTATIQQIPTPATDSPHFGD